MDTYNTRSQCALGSTGAREYLYSLNNIILYYNII